MIIVRTNYVLAALMVVVIALSLMLNTGRTRPHYEIMTEMKYSPAYPAFSENPHFSDGRTMRRPVPDTLAHDQQVFDFPATPAGAVRAGDEFPNPIPREDDGFQASVARGSNIFRVYCVLCHGATGDKDGPVVERGFPKPPPLTTGGSAKMKDGQLFHILTFGQRSMPPFAAQLTRRQRWDAVNYIRSLQPPVTSTAATETSASNDAPTDDGRADENATADSSSQVDSGKGESNE